MAEIHEKVTKVNIVDSPEKMRQQNCSHGIIIPQKLLSPDLNGKITPQKKGIVQ